MHVTDKPFEEQFKWKEVQRARIWRPKPGEALCGYYRGRTLKNGMFGQYEVIIIDDPESGDAFLVSGTMLISMIDVARVPEGHPVRIEFVGRVQIEGTDRWWKKFKLQMAVTSGER